MIAASIATDRMKTTAYRGRRATPPHRHVVAIVIVALGLEALFVGRDRIGTVPQPLPFVLDVCSSARSWRAASRSLVGAGALRVKGLLLAISTMAFAIAAQELPVSAGRSSPGLAEGR